MDAYYINSVGRFDGLRFRATIVVKLIQVCSSIYWWSSNNRKFEGCSGRNYERNKHKWTENELKYMTTNKDKTHNWIWKLKW